ncbi:MAG: exodeoxyribonuclease III [Gammaproteobacteria bacterium]|jgi:exodeoxyribonuclease-3
MKIATWNINSMKVRLPHVLRWLAAESPDIVALQELKQTDADFPISDIQAAGYLAVSSGQKTYNGVAILSKQACEHIETAFPDFVDEQKRLLAVTVNGIRIINVYVPNGQAVGSEKYQYKLMWLEHFYHYLKQSLTQYEKILVVGDFNIAPEDIDVHDPKAWHEQILCSSAERAALNKIFSLGFQDTFRLFPQKDQIYSWWDYRTFAFQGNRGLRIDLMLANAKLAQAIQKCWIDVMPRAWERPSDHAPVIVEI